LCTWYPLTEGSWRGTRYTLLVKMFVHKNSACASPYVWGAGSMQLSSWTS
jgi:hypothetical protein